MKNKILIKGICAALVLAMSSIMLLTGCGDNGASSNTQTAGSGTSSANVALVDFNDIGIERNIYHDEEHKAGYQLEQPEKGEQVAIMHTSMGDISCASSRRQRLRRWKTLFSTQRTAITTA